MVENMEGNPEFTAGYWFPDEHEYRLVYVDPTIPPTDPDQGIAAFRLAGMENGVEITLSVGLVRPDEVGLVPLPAGWTQTWDDATLVQAPERAA